jgi:hypothetical protein
LLRNVFGVSFGVPIRKNRFFFFANYEGRRDAQGTSVLRLVPSTALQQRYIQYLCTLNSNSLNTAACPVGSKYSVVGSDGNTYTKLGLMRPVPLRKANSNNS